MYIASNIATCWMASLTRFCLRYSAFWINLSALALAAGSFEFWYGAGYRLHERVCIELGADGQWSQRLLYP